MIQYTQNWCWFLQFETNLKKTKKINQTIWIDEEVNKTYLCKVRSMTKRIEHLDVAFQCNHDNVAAGWVNERPHEGLRVPPPTQRVIGKLDAKHSHSQVTVENAVVLSRGEQTSHKINSYLINKQKESSFFPDGGVDKYDNYC